VTIMRETGVSNVADRSQDNVSFPNFSVIAITGQAAQAVMLPLSAVATAHPLL
jgi:hypothetical protein